MHANRKTIVEEARAEAQRMRRVTESVEGADKSRAQISMTGAQFAKLAILLDQLAETVTYWPEEVLDDPRYWVPLGHFQKVQAQASHWQAEYQRVAYRNSFDELLRFQPVDPD